MRGNDIKKLSQCTGHQSASAVSAFGVRGEGQRFEARVRRGPWTRRNVELPDLGKERRPGPFSQTTPSNVLTGGGKLWALMPYPLCVHFWHARSRRHCAANTGRTIAASLSPCLMARNTTCWCYYLVQIFICFNTRFLNSCRLSVRLSWEVFFFPFTARTGRNRRKPETYV